MALKDAGLFDESVAAYERAIAIDPGRPHMYYNLGSALKEAGRIEPAMVQLRRAVELKPDFYEASYSIALTQLLQGNWTEGWRGYELRWKCASFRSPRRDFIQPMWDGADPQGRTILLHSEQGFGDTIQFVSLATLVAGRGAKVIVVCQPELRRLVSTVAGVDRVMGWDEPLADFDLHCPLLSLPYLLGLKLEQLPVAMAYVSAPAPDVEKWRQKLLDFPGVLKVGLCWSGGPHPRSRSIPLAAMTSLADVAGTRFFSLQRGEHSAEDRAAREALKLVDYTDQLNDFADTAGLIANLDLVISVDTAVAHLAGAMQKPVYMLLKFMPDFRWMLDREDSPWYPTMRLFRQAKAGDWGGVVQSVKEALVKSAGKH